MTQLRWEGTEMERQTARDRRTVLVTAAKRQKSKRAEMSVDLRKERHSIDRQTDTYRQMQTRMTR